MSSEGCAGPHKFGVSCGNVLAWSVILVHTHAHAPSHCARRVVSLETSPVVSEVYASRSSNIHEPQLTAP